jgi:hypothetical protein
VCARRDSGSGTSESLSQLHRDTGRRIQVRYRPSSNLQARDEPVPVQIDLSSSGNGVSTMDPATSHAALRWLNSLRLTTTRNDNGLSPRAPTLVAPTVKSEGSHHESPDGFDLS